MSAPPPDLLVSGDERGPRPWDRRRRRAAAALVAAAVTVAAAAGAGTLVQRDRAADERRRVAEADQDLVLLSLLRAGQDGGPRYGPHPPGVHVVVANAGPETVRLLRGTLTPGAWRVRVPRGRELRAGRSVVLALTPPRACGTAEPGVLRLEALPLSGRRQTAALDLASAQLAYGGTLAFAVEAAARDCDPTASPGIAGRT